MPEDLERFWSRLSDHENRIRSLESVATPRQKEMVERLVRTEMKVQEMDVHGTAVTQVRLEHIEREIEDIKDVQQGIRATVRSALITGAVSIFTSLLVGIVLYVLLQRGEAA